MFRKYHYLNTNIHKGAKCYVGKYEGNYIVFCAVLPLPHGVVKNFRRVHRLVVLPDYQGIGIGNKFLNAIGEIYLNNGFRFVIQTSNPALIHGLQNQKNWILKNEGFQSKHKGLKSFNRGKRLITSWEMIRREK